MARLPRASVIDNALLLMRLMLGVVFIYHGSQKLFGAFGGPGIAGTAAYFGKQMHLPLPTLSAWLSGLSEFIGGIFLFVGDGLRIGQVPLLINMVVAVIVTAPDGFNVGTHGCEYPLELLVVLLALELTGPGRLTLTGIFSGGGSPEYLQAPSTSRS